MNCKNCGSTLHNPTVNCPTCNVPASFNKHLKVIPMQHIDVPEEDFATCKCPNCNGRQNDPEAIRCEYCNFPLDQNGHFESRSAAKKEQQGFAWRNVGQSVFSMNYDQHLERWFRPLTPLSI
jgi:hypothetical protein